MQGQEINYIRYSKQQVKSLKSNTYSNDAIKIKYQAIQQNATNDKQNKFKEELLTSNTDSYEFVKYDKKPKQKKHHNRYQSSEIKEKQVVDQQLCQWQTFSNKFFDKIKNRTQRNEVSGQQIQQRNSQIISTLRKYKPLVIRKSNQMRNIENENKQLLNNSNFDGSIQEELSNQYRYTFLKNHISNQAIVIKNKADAIDQQRQNQCIKRNRLQRKPNEVQLCFKLPAIDKSQQKLPSIHNLNKVSFIYPKTGRYPTNDRKYEDKLNQVQGFLKQGTVRLYSYRQFCSPSKMEQEATRLNLLRRKQKLHKLGKKRTDLI